MLLDRYESLYFNSNFKESASSGLSAYRGEFIIKEGDVADAQGRRGPPKELLKQAILLGGADELKFVSGSLDKLQHLPLLQEACANYIKAGTLVVLYVVNIDDNMTIELNGTNVYCIPLVQGMVWTELSELAGLEKGDFKGLSAADKVLRLYEELLSNKFKYPVVVFEDAIQHTNNAKRENHGAV